LLLLLTAEKPSLKLERTDRVFVNVDVIMRK